jgi:UDP-N-acetylglucosamine--N-acetylmuramyl-(pentapeptide) pyrophosphoryl-undecaprenol N-acetylglucosamine transferase
MSGPIIIAAGGTGGHLFPALALAEALLARGFAVAIMTDLRTAAKTRELFTAGKVHVLPGAGIAGRDAWRAASAVLALARGWWAARKIMRATPPMAVIGFGGYPSVAPVLAARSLRPRPAILLHEQNAVLGRANRLLARFADALALSFPATKCVPNHIASQITGNPLRGAILAARNSEYHAPIAGPIHLLILGGSLGAKVFSEMVPGALTKLNPVLRERLIVTQQARADSVEQVRTFYRNHHINAEVAPFFTDVAGLLARTHLVISRSGASSIAELTTTGRPSILVPLPGAIDDHQTENCRDLVQRQGAIWIPQPMFNQTMLAAILAGLLTDPAKLAAMAQNARAQALPDAANTLADLVQTTINQRMAA